MDETRFWLARIPESAFSLVVERLSEKRDFTRLALDVIMTHKLGGASQPGCFKLPGNVTPLSLLPVALRDIAPDFADHDFQGWIVSGGNASPEIV